MPTERLRIGEPALLAVASDATRLSQARLVAVLDSGQLQVELRPGHAVCCDVLLCGLHGQKWAKGDKVLVAALDPNCWVVLGRIGRLTEEPLLNDVVVSAASSLQLKCGEASIDLRADGKVLIKGEDVTVRAKGTKRIRAGTVSIN